MTAAQITRVEAERSVREAIRSILPWLEPEQIDGGKHLRELGADSVDRVEIILSVTDRLGLDVPMSAFSDIPNIDALVDYLCEARRP